MAEKITIAQKFAATIAILEGYAPEIEFSTADAIAFLEDRAEKAKSKPRVSKPKPETIEFRKNVTDYMKTQTGAMTAKMVAEALGASAQKASAALRFLANEGVLTVIEGEKAKDAKSYQLA